MSSSVVNNVRSETNPNMIVGAVDIGGTKTALGLINRVGEVLASRSFPTNAHAGYATCREQIASALQAMAAGQQLAGVGVACTGPVDAFAGTIGDVEFLPGWEGQNLVADLEQSLGLPTVLENDADAAALAEWYWGAASGSESCLYVTISTGIGASLIQNGQLFRGAGGAHPEMGHHIVAGPADGLFGDGDLARIGEPVCYCGQAGCWEHLASGPAIERWYGHQPGHYPAITTTAQILAGSDDLSRRAVDRMARHIGIGVANLATILLPDVVVLGGGVTQSLDLLLPGIEAAVSVAYTPHPASPPRLVPALLGPNVALQGAAAAWLCRASQTTASTQTTHTHKTEDS